MKRRVVVIAVVVIGVLGLLVGCDRGVQAIAERRIATEVQTAVGAPQTPSIDLGPFPFLTEIATGRISTARVQLPELTLPDTDGVVVTGVDATLHDVTLSDGFTKVVAGSMEATGVLPYASLSKLTGFQVSYASPGTVSLAFSLTLGQKTYEGTATGRPVLNADEQALAFEDIAVTVPGSEGDQAVLDAAGRLVLRTVPLGQLPYEARITQLEVTDAGVRFGATGTQVPLRG